MDLYCQICGEPFEAYHIQHEISELEKRFFLKGFGCASCEGNVPANGRPEIAQLSAIAHDLLGDDIDGVASMIDDYTFGGAYD